MSLKKASRTKSLSLSDDFPSRSPQRSRNSFVSKKIEDTGKILKYIDDNVIGKGVAFLGPYGRRKVVYADYSSSGRSLQFLEDYINKEVLPAYGDINCTSSVTGLQSLLYYNEARDLIRSNVNASADDEVIFCEAAYTSPIEKIASILCSPDQCDSRPILFVSTSEPDDNLRAWLDAGTQIERVVKTRDGFLDLVDLEKKLATYVESRRPLIGLFAGASRLTGILADDIATTILLHQYGALSIWDYSPAAPCACIDTNPSLPGAAKDVVFFCANKFIGGVQAPGVLVIKKSLLSNKNQLIYDSVGIIGAVRAGLVVQLKESLGTQTIASRNEKLCKQMLSHIRTIPEIVLLGPLNTTAKRIPTLCFLVRHPRSAYLHHRFVVAVLNDVFGIQATAKTNIVEAMGLTKKMIVDYERLLVDDSLNMECIRPGYTQITLPYFMSETEVAFILEALKMVATEAWKLLPQYEVDDTTGEWRHHSNSLTKERKWLGAIRYTDGRMIFSDRRISGPGAFPQNYADCLQIARNLFNRARKMAQRTSLNENIILKLKKDYAEILRWYMLPGEAHELLLGHSQNIKHSVPFDPNKTHEPPSLLNMYRHNSLSALDVKRFKSRSLPTSPIHIPVARQQSTPSPTMSSSYPKTSPPSLKFSVGGEVTTVVNLSPIMGTPTTNNGVSNRNRCHSWSSNGGLISLSPQTRMNLGLTLPQRSQRERLCSCSSQTDVEEIISSENTSPASSLLVTGQAGSLTTNAENIQAYVKEVTNELATEIKSEIREVISKVEDVLDSTDCSDLSSITTTSVYNISSADDMRNDSVSATDVAEYLKEFSKGITSQLKSEIREVVNVMNENEQNIQELQYNYRRYSPPDIFEKSCLYPTQEKLKHRYSDLTPKVIEKSDCENHRSESLPNPSIFKNLTASSPESSTPSCPYTGTISKLIDPIATASQDSGINMYFQDPDDTRLKPISEKTGERIRTFSTQSQILENNDEVDDDNLSFSTTDCKCILRINEESTRTQQLPKYFTRDPTDIEKEKDDSNNWHYLPNQVWKQTSEAIDEFDMVKEGDKILVCISGSSASLCLLHALRQFARARGIHIELGAVSVGSSGVDPRALMLYLRDLDVKYYFEQITPIESLRSKLYTIARQKGYNVLALGNSLDKLADDFLVSVLSKGRLYTTQAHCLNRDEDLRIIRPFIYVRERHFEDFSIQKDLPTRPSKLFTKPPDASNSILKVQEVINPGVYDNIKNALRPLLSLRIESCKSSFEYLKHTALSRE